MAVSAFVCLFLIGCTKESSRELATQKVERVSLAYNQPRTSISVGKFQNRSEYMRGIFSDNVDRLGNQAKTSLLAHLQQTGFFNVLDRENMAEMAQEARIKNIAQQLKGADYIITGDVTEFGRKEVSDRQLMGILGSGKEQIAYAKVMLNVVDGATSRLICSADGAGEYVLSTREVIGFGSRSGYDSTLNGKVLDLAIRQAVNNLVREMQRYNQSAHQ